MFSGLAPSSPYTIAVATSASVTSAYTTVLLMVRYYQPRVLINSKNSSEEGLVCDVSVLDYEGHGGHERHYLSKELALLAEAADNHPTVPFVAL